MCLTAHKSILTKGNMIKTNLWGEGRLVATFGMLLKCSFPCKLSIIDIRGGSRYQWRIADYLIHHQPAGFHCRLSDLELQSLEVHNW
jgi:hypothetical protein